jgi:signal transduction histidine kinase
VLAPSGRDGELVCALLRRAGVDAIECKDVSTLCGAFDEDTGAVLVADEALAGAGPALRRALDAQEPWSDIPVLVFTRRAAGNGLAPPPLAALGSWNVSVLERPIGPAALVQAAQSALRDRRRQYEVRGLLRELATLNETLEARVAERTLELLRQRDQLKSLAAQLVSAEQRERRRISVELHDYLAQILLVCRMRLQTLRPSDERSIETLAEAGKLLSDATQYTRTLMSDLCPAALYELGLEAALESWAEHMKLRHGLEVELLVSGEPREIPEDMRVLLFECVRELLFNVVKHARAKKAEVVLEFEPDCLRVHVQDNGAGFDAAATEFRPGEDGGWGLFNIRERIEGIGGEMAVESAPGHGSRFTLSAPLANTEECDASAPPALPQAPLRGRPSSPIVG